jgi:hypothetical protein
MTESQHIGDTMEPQVWSKAEEKFAHVLTLREHEVHLLKMTGNLPTPPGQQCAGLLAQPWPGKLDRVGSRLRLERTWP